MTPHDTHHYNSFLFENNRIWLLAHNQGASELFAFSCHDQAFIECLRLGNQAHNIRQEEGQLFTCSSADGKIVGDDNFVLKTGGFLRGYLHVNNRRYVGINEPAERKARDWTTSHVLMFDGTMEVVGEIAVT